MILCGHLEKYKDTYVRTNALRSFVKEMNIEGLTTMYNREPGLVCKSNKWNGKNGNICAKTVLV